MADWGDMTISEAWQRLRRSHPGKAHDWFWFLLYGYGVGSTLLFGLWATFRHQWWLALVEALVMLVNGGLFLHRLDERLKREERQWT